jgi:predicted dehydrogenase
MSAYRCVVIGCGLAGKDMPQSHFNGYLRHPRCELVLLIDKDPAKIRGAPYAACEVKQIKHFRPDIVSIATTEGTHLEVFREVLSHWTPQAFFIEKPLATTLDACEEILSVCEEQGITLAVNHARAWDSDVRRMRPTVISYGGRPWRNDVHAFHLASMYRTVHSEAPEFNINIRQVEENGLWADGEKLWGTARKNCIDKAICDIIACTEGKKPYPAGHGYDAELAVESVLLLKEMAGDS